jgi:hypothetical protein
MKYVYKYFKSSIIFELKTKNQLVLLSGIFVILATATIAATFNVQPANAVQPANTPNAYGKEQIAINAKNGGIGDGASSCAHGNCFSFETGAHNGIAEFRANGDKLPAGYDNGQGGPNFRP